MNILLQAEAALQKMEEQRMILWILLLITSLHVDSKIAQPPVQIALNT